MNGQEKNCRPFRPYFRGCVARDARMARALEEALNEALCALAANTYRALICEQRDRALYELFDRMATEQLSHFRLLCELIVALGGTPAIRVQLRPHDARDVGEENLRTSCALEQLLRNCTEEEKRAIDRLQTLMGRTPDRVVRSLLSALVSDREANIRRLCARMT